MKNIRIVAVLLTALLTVSSAAPARERAKGPIELGKITIPRDFELERRIMSKGEYGLILSEDELVLVFRNKADGLEYSMGISTDLEEAKASVLPAKTVVVENVEGGVQKIVIRVEHGTKIYKSALTVAGQGKPTVPAWPLDPAVMAEVEILKEAHSLLERFAAEIWPRWVEFRDLEYAVTFPNRAVLVITPRSDLPTSFARVNVEVPGGKNVFLDRSHELAGRLTGPVGFHGHGDIGGVSVVLTGTLENEGTSQGTAAGAAQGGVEVKRTRKGQPSGAEPEAAADPKSLQEKTDEMTFARMMMYVHEAFHVLQASRQVEAEKKGIRRPAVEVDRDFAPNLEFSVYAEVEGEALRRAVAEKDPKAAFEFFKDAVAAREIRLGGMTPGAVALDRARTSAEGSATWSDIAMAMLVVKNGLDRAAAGKTDVVSRALTHAPAFIAKETEAAISALKGQTMDVTEKYYVYGAYQCLLLDRFVPAWKEGFFENVRFLDDVIARFLNLGEEEKSRISARLRTDFAFDEIRARHAPVIQARDDAIRGVAERKGLRFLIDVKGAQGGFDINPREFVLYKSEQIYPRGLASFKYGSLKLTSEVTPMRFLMPQSLLEWVDTQAKEGEKSYELEYREKAGDLYKGVTLKTRGFSLTAAAVTIAEEAGTVRIAVHD